MLKTLMALFLILQVSVAAAGADYFRPGYWQLDSTVEMPNMPALLTSASSNVCFRADEARDPRRIVFRQKECTFTAFSKASNRMTWKMTCKGSVQGALSGEALFSEETFRSSMQLRSGDSVSTLQVNARRLGECPDRSPDPAPPRRRPDSAKKR